MKVLYPASHEIPKLNDALLSLKIARHSSCSICNSCNGLHPPFGVNVTLDDELETEFSLGDPTRYSSDDDDAAYLDICACEHSVKEHSADQSELGEEEFARRARVAARLDELLQVRLEFPFYYRYPCLRL